MSYAHDGYAGKCLHLDLCVQSSWAEKLDPEVLRDYLGGTGYAARILYDGQKPGIDPLSPEAMLVVSTGPLTLNAVPGGGSVELCFKSPLTGGWGESRAGSDFGPDLRRAGFDHVVIRGRAPRPVYVVIRDGTAEYRPAEHLAGKLGSEKLALIRRELPDGDRKSGV